MPRERRTVAIAYFLLFLGAGVWLPYFPLYLSHLGYRGWQIGLIAGMQPALRWSSAVAWAWLADRFRVRHWLLVATALAGALFFVPLFFVRDFMTLCLVLGAVALLHGALIPMIDATVMDHLPGLGGDYGRLRLWGSLGFVAGASLSAPLIQAFSPSVVPLLLFLPNLGLVPALLGLPRGQLGRDEPFQAPWRLVTPPLAALLATSFLLQLSCGAWGGFFAVHTARLGLSDAVPGVTWALAVTGEVVVLFWGRKVVEWLAPGELILVVLLVTVARWALTAVARHEWLVIALQLGHAFTFSAFHLAALLLLSRLVPAQSSTGGQAMYGVVSYGLGGSLGLALAGGLIDRIGSDALFGFEAMLAVLALLPALQLRRLVRWRPLAGRERATRHSGAWGLLSGVQHRPETEGRSGVP